MKLLKLKPLVCKWQVLPSTALFFRQVITIIILKNALLRTKLAHFRLQIPYFKQLTCFILALILMACNNKEGTFLVSPPYFAQEIPQPERNPITKEGIELGRMLFYDRNLSANKRISCSSCHVQRLAFTDGTALASMGVSKKRLLRHAPSLVNLAWQENGLFWEGGAKDLESLVFAPLTHPDEMGMDLTQLADILKNRYDYANRFKEVFGVDEIQSAYVARALAQFQRTLISDNSRYDQYLRKEIVLNEKELKGLKVFQNKCGSCHQGSFLTDHSFHNNGLDAAYSEGFEGIFQGRFRISKDSADMGKFKTPSLRNVMLTAPYMHDGRLTSIQEVLDHYSGNLKNSPTLDSALRNKDREIGIALNEAEKEAIVAFLHTLTDSSFIMNSAYSNPF